MTPSQQRFVDALAAFKAAASELNAAWEADDVPDDVGSPEYPFEGDFAEVPLALGDWEEAVKKEFES